MPAIIIEVKKPKIQPDDVMARNDPGEAKAPVYNEAHHAFEWREVGHVGAGSDMRKTTYDQTESGTPDNADKLQGNTLAQVRDHAPKEHSNGKHLHNYLTTCDKYTKAAQDALGIDAATLETQDLAGVRNHAPNTHGNERHSATYITTCDKYTKAAQDALGIDAATLDGKGLGICIDDIAYYDANGRVVDTTKVKGTTVDATAIGAGKLLAYDSVSGTLIFKTLTELMPAIDTSGKLILTGAGQIGTKTGDLAELWDKTTKLTTADFEATEFDLANKIPLLDASAFLSLGQVVGNVPGLNAAGSLVLTAIGTPVADLAALWTKATKLVTGDIAAAEFNVASKLLKLDGSAKVPYAQMPAVGGTATLLVAAVDSDNVDKADYKCNGTNDEVTINSAIAALPASGGTVVLLEGNYKLSNKIAITANNITLKGQGRGTRLYLANGIQTNIVEATAVSGILLERLYIDGTTSAVDAGVNWNQCGILFNNVDESKIFDCWVESNKRSGIHLYNGSAQNEVIGCLCKGNTFYGILLLTSSSYNVVKGNTCTSNSQEGIIVSTASIDNSITGNTCNNNLASGVYIHSTSNNNTVSGNTCHNNGNDGIGLDTNVQYNSVTGNNCVANGQHGIALYSTSYYNPVANNTCNSNTANGIYVETNVGNTIAANTCSKNTLRGVLLDNGCTNNTVNGNTCNDNTKEGIKLVDSSNSNTITGNVCYSNGDASNLVDGIFLDTTSNSNTVTGNTCNNNANNGICVQSSSYNTITGNTCIGNTSYGILLTLCIGNTVSSNTCIGNYTDDIHLVSDADYNNVQGNTCRAGTRTAQPNYGINVATLSCDANMITNNDMHDDGFALGAFNNTSPTTVTAAGNRT